MSEGLTPQGLPDDSEFDRIVEHVVSAPYVPIYCNGLEFRMDPTNTVVRLFFEGEEGDLGLHSRALIDMGDGSQAPFKPEDETLRELVRIGCWVELPDKPDKSDEEFLYGYGVTGADRAQSFVGQGLDD